LDTADDNSSFSRTFEVFVQSCENQLPTLDPIDDLTIDVNTLATPLDGSIQWRAEDGGNDHWYKLIKNNGTISWTDAQAAAEQLGAHLATVTSAAEDQFLAENLLSPTNQWPHTVGPWIGAYQDQNSPDYSEPAGGWKWVTGEPMDFMKWNTAEPNNQNGEHYVHYDHPNNGLNRWNDLSDHSTRPFSYIIEMSQGSALETINLAGITDGGEKNQSLKVTATSSNTDLLPSPGVTYTSAETTGLLSLEPTPGQHGTSTVTVTVEDAGLDLDLSTTADNGTFSRTFDVTVNPAPNVTPIAQADSFDVLEDSTGNSLNVLANDTDPNGDPLIVTQVSQASAGGSVQLGPDGTLLYTPRADFFGDDTFTYTIDDGNGGQASAQVLVNVANVNDAPTALDDSFSVSEDSL
ncbi:MAG: hypothetical protein GY917_13425, partial [Planctomycetaceae bacterium]|nr:hypothetical protein [Planctomycetaceae bacterium]